MSRPPHQENKVEAILDALANAPAHIVPLQLLDEAHDHREALIPPFQQAVAQAHALSAGCRLQAEGDWRLPCFALHFLAAWRVPGTYDLILDSLMLDDRYDSRWLMCDAYNDWPHLLITTFDGDVARLLRILQKEDPPWNSDLRTCLILLLGGVYHHRLGDRAAIEAAFDQMLDTCDSDLIMLTIANCIARAKMKRLLPRLHKMMQDEVVSELDVRGILDAPWEEGVKNLASCPNPIVNPRQDLADIISMWFYFRPPFVPSPEVKQSKLYQWEIQINDTTARPGPFILRKRTLPCNCDSGLPYGACCAGK
ncbi:MAG TPA: hypothetical protein DIT13_17855 [Verrucomicrobiales bacterium]|nr:hypothetical protein [Verrucomicrobiales bacterium]HRJ10533.1 hypothetical protein [Prosthecobacter sp.]HRK16645.1 hypothetical protein [Prosthecobacter sp.]